MRTWLQSQSSSSATIIGSEALRTVRRSSAARDSGSGDMVRLLFDAGGDADRAADAVVAAAAADIAAHRRVDLGVARPGAPPEQRARRHDLARLTVATLHHVDLEPGTLQPLAG